MLEDKIRALRKKKKLLLMPHLVLGFPSFEENRKLIDTMIEAGAEIIEMQIPFSEPMADGPVIMKAGDEALKNGTTVTACLSFAQKICAAHPETIFIFMTYYNIPFTYGVGKFIEKAKAAGIEGMIVPDLPPEEGGEYLASCDKAGIAPIFLFTPTNTKERLETLSKYGKGMAYCVGRKGVTGIKTKFDESLNSLIRKYKSVTKLPVGLGFGIQDKADVDALPAEVDIAIIGTKLLTLQKEQGNEAVGQFLRGLRE
ncbi:MAG: tryptophan synthase subunit alpha [Candidatus Omnitrophota bacterium]